MAYRDEPDIDLSGSDPEIRKELRPYFWPMLFFLLGLPALRMLNVSNALSWAAFGFVLLWFFAVWLKVRITDQSEKAD